MRILITGGAGFIGSHLADALLADGHAVAVLDDLSTGTRANVPADARFYEVDIRDADAVDQAFADFRPQLISHQAAQMSVSRSVREPGFDADVNLLGLIHVLDAAVRQKAARVVIASSGGVLYGETNVPAGEEVLPNPQSPYGISKWAGERYLAFYHREHGLAGAALRYANVYGERQNPHGEAGVVAIFSTRMLQGEAATINGDGHYVRDYVHVSDVVAANRLALLSDEPGVTAYNVGTAIGTDVNQLAGSLRTHCEKERQQRGHAGAIPSLEHGPPRPGDLRSNIVSFEKIHAELGWRPRVALTEGLQQTVNWFADELNI